jgi:hypothetical protein
MRMALAGSRPTARDRREFRLMTAEKVVAFYESWTAMYVQMLRCQWQTGAEILRSIWFPSLYGPPLGALARRRATRSALAILNQGLAPIHRRAVANARRLGRARTR